MPYSVQSILPLFFIFVHLAGCSVTELRPEKLALDTMRLSRANNFPLQLFLPGGIERYSAGHQFGALFLPLGEIVVIQPRDHLFKVAFELLSLKGYSIEPASEPSKSALMISLSELSCTAYDLFFTRRVSCKVTVAAMYESKLMSFDGSSARWSLRPFGPVIEHVLEASLKSALDEVSRPGNLLPTPRNNL